METLLKLLTLLRAPLWIILALVIVLIAIFIALVILKDKCYKVEVLENVEIEKLYVDVGEVVVFGKVRDLKLGVGKVKNNNYLEKLKMKKK